MVDAPHPVRPDLLTIGHSNRSFDEFAHLLAVHGVRRVVDVRSFPGSRRLPHFGREQLGERLGRIGVDYLHLRGLGGRRALVDDAPTTWGDAWRNAAFRAYAQYAHTVEFAAALDELEAAMRGAPTAIMCSEAVPWRCHRWLVSDVLVARGVRVGHIVDASPPREHRLSAFAVVATDGVDWPGPPSHAPLTLGPAMDG